MKNQFLLFLCLLFPLVSSSQKKYSFDYRIEYDFQYDESTKPERKYFFTNSEDNSYFLIATNADSIYMDLDFYDEKGIRSIVSLKKEDFLKFGILNLDCEFVKHPVTNTNNDRYFFLINQDTLIENVAFRFHKLSYSSKKEAKKYNKGSANYIVEPNTDFHKPLLAFSFSFDVVLRNDSMRNGIAKEIFTTDYKQNNKKFIYKLIGYSEIEKFLVIPKECCLTN